MLSFTGRKAKLYADRLKVLSVLRPTISRPVHSTLGLVPEEQAQLDCQWYTHNHPQGNDVCAGQDHVRTGNAPILRSQQDYVRTGSGFLDTQPQAVKEKDNLMLTQQGGGFWSVGTPSACPWNTKIASNNNKDIFQGVGFVPTWELSTEHLGFKKRSAPVYATPETTIDNCFGCEETNGATTTQHTIFPSISCNSRFFNTTTPTLTPTNPATTSTLLSSSSHPATSSFLFSSSSHPNISSTLFSSSSKNMSNGSSIKGKLKRPYKGASAAREAGGQYSVLLDERELMTPAKKPVRVPSLPLAYAIAAEWEWQEGLKLRPYIMPLMKLTATAIDQMPRDRTKVIKQLVGFFHTDQVLLRHPETDDAATPDALNPGLRISSSGSSVWGSTTGLDTIKGEYFAQHQRKLGEKEREIWDPLLEMLRTKFNITAVSSSACFPPPQPESSIAALKGVLEEMDNWELTAVDSMAGSARSISVALLVAKGCIDVEEAIAAAHLEEDFQISQAGFVEGGHDIDLADLRVKLEAPSTFLKLIQMQGQT